jgi:gas vesicle protein
MTNVVILLEAADASETRYLAVGANRHSVGPTPGQALDALTAQLSEAEKRTLVVIRDRSPDEFFTSAQCQRLQELMRCCRAARDGQASCPSVDEQAELDALVQAEVQAAGARAAALSDQLNRVAQLLEKAQEKAQELMKEARQNAQRLQDDIVAKTKAEIGAERERLHREIDFARDEAIKEIWRNLPPNDQQS